MKKIWSKGLAALLAVFMVSSAGCSQSNSANSPGNSADPSKTPTSAPTTKFPEKAIEVIVPFAAGGSTDLTARAIAKDAEKIFGKPLVIVNRPGGSGAIGTSEIIHAKADGYTIGYTNGSSVCILPGLGNVDYKSSDIEPIAYVTAEPVVYVAKKGRFKDFEDFINQVKEKPGTINYAISTAGAIPHLGMEQLASMAKLDIKSVGFKGAAEAIPALLGGHMDICGLVPMEAKLYVESGDMIVLAVGTKERVPLFKDAPTLAEKGYDLDLSIWRAIFAPKDMPEDVKKVLVDGFKTVLTNQEFIDELAKSGQEIKYIGPDEVKAMIEKETEDYTKVIKDTGLIDKMKGL